MSYTAAALCGVAVTCILDLVLLRTCLLGRRLFWMTYGVVLLFQLASNGVLTGAGIVRYDPAAVSGPRLASAPVEDLFFGFALVAQSLSWWVWWGGAGRHRSRRDDTARPQPGTATRARRRGPTVTRRSSTR
ncbi:MAG: lycopene cyclase domain-containing protein [Actinomycetota bacterium]|nr:lycopene cyclase domain-containing protein [Actinomycetota bacterium]